MRHFIVGFTALAMLAGAGEVKGAIRTYKVYEEWGGTWSDAEKSLTTSDDDLLCWAAACSNVLEWSGWDAGFADTDAMFAHYQAHFPNVAGDPYSGWKWWFSGVGNWDVPGGGNFYPGVNIDSVADVMVDKPAVMSTIDNLMHDQHGIALNVSWPAGGGSHLITAWGFDYDDSLAPTDPNYYTKIYVTDSDDDQATGNDTLRGYNLSYDSGNSWWVMADYNNAHINYVYSLQANPANAIPEPASISIALWSLVGAMGIYMVHRRRKQAA